MVTIGIERDCVLCEVGLEFEDEERVEHRTHNTVHCNQMAAVSVIKLTFELLLK